MDNESQPVWISTSLRLVRQRSAEVNLQPNGLCQAPGSFYNLLWMIWKLTEKDELRKRMRQRRKAMDPKTIDAASKEIFRHLFNSRLWQEAKVIHTFLPQNTEPNTFFLVQEALRTQRRHTEQWGSMYAAHQNAGRKQAHAPCSSCHSTDVYHFVGLLFVI